MDQSPYGKYGFLPAFRTVLDLAPRDLKPYAPTAMDQLLQIRSEPPRARPACLDYGFRLFFFGAALWTVVSMALWVPAYLGHLPAGLFLSYGSPRTR